MRARIWAWRDGLQAGATARVTLGALALRVEPIAGGFRTERYVTDRVSW